MTTTTDQRFEQFHRENPHVYAELLKLARRARATGSRRIGIKMLFEVIRWQRYLRTTDPDFKLNNNLHSRYARLLMAENPDLGDLFETRGLRS